MALFAGVSAAHLGAAVLKKRSAAVLTKVCLMPLLAAVYMFGTDGPFIPLLCALVFGWCGDVFLLRISELRFFRLGLASFFLGHLCYIFSFIFFAGGINLTALAISAAAAAPLALAVYSMIRPEKTMRLPAIAYEIVILFMSLSALQLFLARRDGGGLLVFAGSLCFILSDTILARFTFGTKPRYGDFFVMLTYIAAQSGIVWGMMG
jgi:uncharacterized membrane protein YhhN